MIENFEEMKKFFLSNYKEFGLSSAISKTSLREGVSVGIIAGRISHELRHIKKIYSALSPFMKSKINYCNI